MVAAFCCTGNTCRSPMAEFLMKNALKNSDIRGLEVISFGLSALANDTMSSGACDALRELGVEFEAGRKARQVSVNDIDGADIILTMTAGHKEVIAHYFPEAKGKTFTLTEYAGLKGDIIDPFGGDIEDYRACAAAIKRCVDIIAEKISQGRG